MLTEKRILYLLISLILFAAPLLAPMPWRLRAAGAEVCLEHSDPRVLEALSSRLGGENINESLKIVMDKDYFYRVYRAAQGVGVDIRGSRIVPGEKYSLAEVFDIQAEAARRSIAVLALMATLWVTEAIPIAVTALIPLFAFPLLGVASLKASQVSIPRLFVVYESYFNDIIALFMAVFFLTKALEKWGVHKRLALMIAGKAGSSPYMILLGLMASVAVVSMFMSNTAATAAMLPVALAISSMIPGEDFRRAVMLGIAYAASIGGVGTLIGTPPNLVFANFAHEYGLAEIGFTDWLKIGIPFVVLGVPVLWLVLVSMCHVPTRRIEGFREFIGRERARLGKPGYEERLVGAVFLLVVLLWLTRKRLDLGAFSMPGWGEHIGGGVASDAVVAILGAFLLFLLPSREGGRLLGWDDAERIPWGVLLLFGGGLALGNALRYTGAALFISSYLSDATKYGEFVSLFLVVNLACLLTEVASNTATANLLMPVMYGVAALSGEDPLLYMLAATIASSFAFALPVATPPNAIVFSSGNLRVKDMVKAGVVLHIVYPLLLTALLYAMKAYGHGVF